MGINMSLSPLWISLKVALCATLFTFILGLLAARWVVSLKRGKAFLDGVFSLPMVLPPTVVGFFLLLLFGRNSLLGNLLLKLGIQVMFTWQGAVIAAVVVSFSEDSSAAEDSGWLLSLLCLPQPVNAEPASTPARSSAVNFFHDLI